MKLDAIEKCGIFHFNVCVNLTKIILLSRYKDYFVHSCL